MLKKKVGGLGTKKVGLGGKSLSAARASGAAILCIGGMLIGPSW